MRMRPVVTADEARRRLALIFPRSAFDNVLSNPLAGAAVAAMIYVDAVSDRDADPESVTWARPSTCTWMSNEVLELDHPDQRRAWRDAAASGSGKNAVETLLQSWGMSFRTGYADNSRETLRDETFRLWNEFGALRKRSGLPTSSSKPRWALYSEFADLFRPDLRDDDLTAAIARWRDEHMAPGPRLRAQMAMGQEAHQYAVMVMLPGHTSTRQLEPGLASAILKSVIEEWAPRRLGTPFVITVSEPGDKLFVGDAQLLKRVGVSIDVSGALPDALIADIATDPVTFWIIEAAATDGVVSEGRKEQLLEWAEGQGISRSACEFLTAFQSRGASVAKRRLKDIASQTWAYFADEPDHELAWYQLP